MKMKTHIRIPIVLVAIAMQCVIVSGQVAPLSKQLKAQQKQALKTQL